MIHIDQYMAKLMGMLQAVYHERLVYVGLQGSYLRGEATETSDIDIMVVIDGITVKDLKEYRKILCSLEDYEKSCGFICGREDLQKWNPLEISHVLHSTKDYYGVLSELVPVYSGEDIRNFVRLSVNNLYHEICHRYIHSSREKNVAMIPYTYKAVFFILQNIYYLDKDVFINTKAELSARLSGKDKQVLDTAVSLSAGTDFDFEDVFALLFSWCQETIARI